MRKTTPPGSPTVVWWVGMCLYLSAGVLGERGWSQGTTGPGDWFMFRHDSLHNGRSTLVGPATPAQKWAFPAGDVVQTSPVTAKDGTVYFGSDDSKVNAVNPNGKKKSGWPFTAGGPVRSSPAVGLDGTVYVGSDDKKVYALNPDGTKKWEFPTGDKVRSSPALGGDGTIYVGSDDGKVYAFNANGTKKWDYAAGGAVESSPAVSSDGTIYVGCSDSNVYALKSDGTKKWQAAIGGLSGAGMSGVYASPAIGSEGSIIVGSDMLYALNAADGTEKWHFVTGGSIASSPAIGFDGTIYVGGLDSKVYAITSMGVQKWVFSVGGPVLSSPAVGGDGTVYVGSQDKKLYAVNLDGTKQWEFVAGDVVDSSPAIGADGTIYVGAGDKNLYAIGPGIGGSTTPPQVTANQPTGSQVPIGSVIVVTFSKSMNQDATSAAFSISPPVSGAITWSPNGKTMTFALGLGTLLKTKRVYTVKFTTAAKDLVGNTLDGNRNGISEGSPADDFSWQFTTNDSTVTVSSITPNTGLNNGSVDITSLVGTDFRAGATAKLSASGQKDIVATNVKVVSSAQITCTFDLRARLPGVYDVTVANTNGQSGTLAGGFTITGAPLSVQFILPNSAPKINALVPVDILGSSFTAGMSIKLINGGTVLQPDPDSVNLINSTEVHCNFNFGSAPVGEYDVVVTNPPDPTDTTGAPGATAKLIGGFHVQNTTINPLVSVKTCSEEDSQYSVHGAQMYQTVQRLQIACYNVNVVNGGNTPQQFRIAATESKAPGWSIAYFWQSQDITSDITSRTGFPGPSVDPRLTLLQPGVGLVLNVYMQPDVTAVDGSSAASSLSVAGPGTTVGAILGTTASGGPTTSSHDLALTLFRVSPNTVSRGQAVTLAVTAKNLGTETEKGVTFRITTNNGGVVIKQMTIASWRPGLEYTGSFEVPVAQSVPAGDYLITGEISQVPGETNTANNKQTVKLTVQ